jgi:hypothetical protein
MVDSLGGSNVPVMVVPEAGLLKSKEGHYRPTLLIDIRVQAGIS